MAQGYLARKKFARKIFKFVYLSLFHNYKIVVKVRISSPLQTWLVDSSNRKETRPRRPWILVWKFSLRSFPLQDVPVPLYIILRVILIPIEAKTYLLNTMIFQQIFLLFPIFGLIYWLDIRKKLSPISFANHSTNKRFNFLMCFLVL